MKPCCAQTAVRLAAFAAMLGAVPVRAETAAAGKRPPTARAQRDLPDAPKVGDRVPDFSVTDQDGKTISFHAKRGTQKAYLMIVRSASW